MQGPNAGNLDLKEETADTYTIGFVWEPSFLDGFTLIADYYEIEIEDAITSVTTQDTVDLCYTAADFPNNRFCNVVTRNPFSGEVTEVINFQENLNEQKVSGLDVSLNYDSELGFLPGEIDLDVRYSHYFDDETTFEGIGGVPLTTSSLGEIDLNEEEARTRVRYELGGFRLSYTWLWTSGGVDDIENDSRRTDDRFFEVDDQNYHNISASYTFGTDVEWRVYGGVNNLTDDLGPFVPGGLDNGSTRNIVTDLNNPLGREFFLGVRARF